MKPLAELRLKITSTGTINSSDPVKLSTLYRHYIDLTHLSKLIQEALTIAKDGMPEIIDPLNLCQQMVGDKISNTV